ncbi:hypothetical protein [Aestuariirhabdus sp. LZHN29]|uniref:hypothetical protein n=1 Tax=Aestuariirhabdus sp. LZHN29 TaxID=3417462 RepID=UPI003CF6DD46
MGAEIDRTEFSSADFERFRQRLREGLEQLDLFLKPPHAGEGPASFGAELELYIIDADGQPMPINRQLALQCADANLSLELNRFNIEYNFPPIHNSSTPFRDLRQQMDEALGRINSIAGQLEARIVPIGILPTLRMCHMGEAAITDSPRYRVLADSLRKQRGEDFSINISGPNSLQMRWQEITLEGANTSFQYHYRVSPANFTDTYNAAQLVSPLLVALGANSPLFLGHRLWHETRVALFKQSIDPRTQTPLHRSQPSRVYFGHRWVQHGIIELFEEGVSLFPPLLPIVQDESPAAPDHHSGPSLAELRLHQGSIWSWNRPLYDPADGGHLRIELRALPAGPTSQDMAALAAFAIGLIEGIRPQMPRITESMPFSTCEQNFYRAAREGIATRLVWPDLKRSTLKETNLPDLIETLLPTAREGLRRIEVDEEEIEQQMELVRRTSQAQTNGALWQLTSYQRLSARYKPAAALSALVETYYQRQQSGLPVCQWRLADEG